MTLQIIRTRHPPEPHLEQIPELLSEVGIETTLAQIRGRIEALPRHDRLLLALDGDRLIAFAHLRIAHDLLTDETAEVVGVVVRASHRRQGVGRRLIAAAEAWARESGRARLLLRTDVVRTDAHAFYVAQGYEQAATMLEFVRDLERARKAEAPTEPR
jgi:GNAT superfamily N-acetyltransferase